MPDDHAAAAVWWRITADLHRHYGGQPHTGDGRSTRTGWVDRLQPLVGEARARDLRDSPYWPLLVERIDDALDRGWPLDQLIAPAAEHPTMDACLALVCTIAPPPNPRPTSRQHPPSTPRPTTSTTAGRQPQPAPPPRRTSRPPSLDQLAAASTGQLRRPPRASMRRHR